VAALAKKRANRIVKLKASVDKLLAKKRTWTNRDLRALRGNLRNAATAANVTAVRKAANGFKKQYQRKVKEVEKGSLN
jgi:hypothetical protein